MQQIIEMLAKAEADIKAYKIKWTPIKKKWPR
jgi:hypothetical protein